MLVHLFPEHVLEHLPGQEVVAACKERVGRKRVVALEVRLQRKWVVVERARQQQWRRFVSSNGEGVCEAEGA